MSEERTQHSGRDLDALFRRMAEEDSKLQAPASIEVRLRGAFEEHHQSRRRARWTGLAAAAALILGVVSASLWPGARPQPVSVTQTNAPVEVGTDYFPLRAGPVLNPGEIGRVVRMPASRSLMARYGFAPASRNGTPVHADLLIGMDGSARALRFVTSIIEEGERQ